MTERRPTLYVVAGPNGSGISFVDRAYIYDNSIDNQLPACFTARPKGNFSSNILTTYQSGQGYSSLSQARQELK